MWAKSQCSSPPLLTLLFVNFYGSLVVTISHREKLRLGLFEWSSRGYTAAFDRHIVNTIVGAPLTVPAIVCNKVKTIQGSWICLVIFIPWSRAGLTCIRCLEEDIYCHYSNSQKNHVAGICSLPCVLFVDIWYKISMEQPPPYLSSGKYHTTVHFNRRPVRMCAKHWLLRWLATIWWYQQQL